MTKVLVIDDDRDMCLLLKKFLERNNYEVVDFTSGKKRWPGMKKICLILFYAI